MTDALQVVDDRSAAVATAPRITKAYIESQIVGTYYTYGDHISGSPDAAHLTVCMIRCRNGFMVLGETAPMSPENFNAELGRQLAYEDAFRKLWPLYAFAALETNK